MTAAPRLPVILLWHMHQPQYRDALTGRYALPWTYLHAIKDYTDMAAHLESNREARCVVNFTPLLIEQLEEIALRRWGTPREFGDVVCFLASDRARYVTGQTVVVDGGLKRFLF